MKIAIVTFDGFNELDSFIASAILNRVDIANCKAEITSPSETVVSMNGVEVKAQKPLEFSNEADVVLFGSGINSRKIIEDESIMSSFKLSPVNQLIGSQCSGALFLKKLGLLENLPICTDSKTRPFIENLGAEVIDKPFVSSGNIATSGGCMSSQYLAMWVITRLYGIEKAKEQIQYVAPVGQKQTYLSLALEAIEGSYV